MILVCVSLALPVAGMSIFINANSNSVVSLSLLEQNLEVLARGESPFCYNGGGGVFVLFDRWGIRHCRLWRDCRMQCKLSRRLLFMLHSRMQMC